MFSIFVCVFFCVCVQVDKPCDELITRPRSPTEYLNLENRNETESFMEGGQAPNWGCSAKETK
jgi:hypothetical protein